MRFRDLGGSSRALIVVRNDGRYDARVHRAFRVLARIGYEPTVVGVVSDSAPEAFEERDGVPIRRLAPAAPFASLGRRILSRRRSTASASQPRGWGASTAQPAPRRHPAGLAAAAIQRLYRLAVTIDYYRRAIALVRAERPALVHCNDYNTMWIGVAARALVGSRVIYDIHELWPDRNGRREWRPFLLACEALFVRSAHATITTSPGYARAIAARYRVPQPELVRNIPQDGGPPRERPAGRAGPLAVYVGGLLTHRGLEQSIECLSLLPELRLRLVGPSSPAYRDRLEGLAEAGGVRDRVEFRSPVLPSEVTAALWDADLGLALIQPACLSYRLTLPNKLFEYVKAGLPIVGSSLPVIEQFVEESGAGLAARPDDVEDIAAKIRAVLATNRFSDAARAAASSYSWDREAEVLERAYGHPAGGTHSR